MASDRASEGLMLLLLNLGVFGPRLWIAFEIRRNLLNFLIEVTFWLPLRSLE